MQSIILSTLSLVFVFFSCTPRSSQGGEGSPAVEVRSAAMDEPNVILIVADDLGVNDLAVYGNSIIETPRLDALANGGLRFTAAYCAAPICSPSRAAIQTGLHPARIGMTEHLRGTPAPRPCQPLIAPKNAGRLAYAYRTIGEELRDDGYRTVFVGKWHLGGRDYGPTNHGYDESYASGPQGLPRSFKRPFFNGNPFPELTTIAGADDYLTNAITTLAIHALPDGPSDQPFFMDLNYYSPHVPIEGPDELVTKYEAILAATGDTFPKAHYAAMVERIDQQVGRLVDTLDARGLLENTVILFTSDHGALTVKEVPGFDQHTPPTDSGPLRGGKGYLFEGGLRVPLIAYNPARFLPAVVAEPNTNTDYLPTITALAGDLVTTPDGKPISALTNSVALEEPRPLYWHFPHYSPQQGLPAGVVIDGPDKLIDWYSDVDSTYYFRLPNDPGEASPDRSLGGRAEELLSLLSTWRDTIGARPMLPNPNYAGTGPCPKR